MAHPDRLSALDVAFLDLEREGSHMHVASCMVFSGDAPAYEDLLVHLDGSLDLAPRYRRRLAFVPLAQTRPRWVDDPHFALRYHVRHTALPSPGGEDELKRLAARGFSQPLDRSKPLWELWLVEGLEPGLSGQPGEPCFALLGKSHHALVDGVSGVDITSVLFNAEPDPAPRARAEPWIARPLPSRAQLIAEALAERAATPAQAARQLRGAISSPGRLVGQLRRDAGAVGAFAAAGLSPAPGSPLNVDIGPHRRFDWVKADLRTFKAVKDALGGTVNDALVTVVALALRRFLQRRRHDTEGLVLRALIPVSVRADAERGALGNRVAAMWAPLPVHVADPRECYALVSEAMAHLKDSGQAVGARVLTQLGDFAPPTILAQAARLQPRQRFFNLVVTNVPGPQFPLYVLGRRLRVIYPLVPLARRQALGVAIMSYDGVLGFGLNGDYDAMPDLADFAGDVRGAIRALAEAAGVALPEDAGPPLGFAMPRARPARRPRGHVATPPTPPAP